MSIAKKSLSVALAIILATACLGIVGSAKRAIIPSIVIPGLFQSEVFYYEDGEIAKNADGAVYEKPFFLDTTGEIVEKAMKEAVAPIVNMVASQEDKDEAAANALAKVLAEVLMEKQRCDENGKFIYDIRATKYNTSFAELNEHDRQYIFNELPLQRYAELAGEENLFVFSYASLGNMIDTAQELYEFIAEVKRQTGSSQVNIVPISQGGSVANALLQIYADNGRSVSEDIHRILYIVPALDGSLLLGEIYQNGLIDEDSEIYRDMIPSLMEGEWSAYLINAVLRVMPNADLNNILDKAIDALIGDYMAYSTLMWGLIPSVNYPISREKYLSGDSFQNIREQTDWFYNAQLNRYENILNAKKDGVGIFNIVDYNVPLYELVDSYDKVNADGIIHLESESMGAYSVGVDKKLPDGYKGAVNNCTDKAHHDHTDPHGIVDACSGLLPETTFYFYNQNHEKTANNNIIMFLAAELLTNDSFVDVHSYPSRFPQFNEKRSSKGFMADVEAMKSFDTTGLSDEMIAEIDAAIIAAEEAIEDTAMGTKEFDKAKADFYAVRAKAQNGGVAPEVKEPSKFDFNDILAKLFKFFNDVFYWLFQGDSIGDIIGWDTISEGF